MSVFCILNFTVAVNKKKKMKTLLRTFCAMPHCGGVRNSSANFLHELCHVCGHVRQRRSLTCWPTSMGCQWLSQPTAKVSWRTGDGGTPMSAGVARESGKIWRENLSALEGCQKAKRWRWWRCFACLRSHSVLPVSMLPVPRSGVG